MKRPLFATALAAAAIFVPASSASPAPSIRLVDRNPFVVAGTNFHPLGRVTVTVYSPRKLTLATTASRTGQFRLIFSGVVVGRCSRPQVRAVGTRGEVAVLKLPALACMPQ